MKSMEEILRELNEAFVILGTMSLCGDNVDTMAVAKAKLRNVFAQLRKLDGEKEEKAE